MSIEPRAPPPQFVARLRHALACRAGWGGFALQILFVAILVWIGYEIVANARANLQSQRITSGFGFLERTAGFDGGQYRIAHPASDTYTRVFLLHSLNTLVVRVNAEDTGVEIRRLVARGRLSPNWLLARIS